MMVLVHHRKRPPMRLSEHGTQGAFFNAYKHPGVPVAFHGVPFYCKALIWS
jgi:hypothetical protein